MRPAIPLSIELILKGWHDVAAASVILERLNQGLSRVEIDAERGRKEVLAQRDELLAKGTPEIILAGLTLGAEHTSSVTIRWDDWPNNYVNGHVCDINPALEELSLGIANHDFSFAKFAAKEIGKVLNATVTLKSSFNRSIETAFFPKEMPPTRWIQQYYDALTASAATYDPVTQSFSRYPQRHPALRELEPWQLYIQKATVSFLEQYRQTNSEAITEGFSTYSDYATEFVAELRAFDSFQHCWSVDIDQPHHNRALIEYSEWLALINLSGVPSGLFK